MPSIVPDPAKLDPLRVLMIGERASGFRHVYYAGVDDYAQDVWVGRVKVGGRLVRIPDSRSVHPHVAAMAVADWFAARMGPWWSDYVRRSDEPPYEARYSRGYGGWLACVWIAGACEDVTHLRRGRPTQRVRVFECEADAVRGADEYLLAALGLFKEILAFRKLRPGEFGTRGAKTR